MNGSKILAVAFGVASQVLFAPAVLAVAVQSATNDADLLTPGWVISIAPSMAATGLLLACVALICWSVALITGE